MVLLKDMRRPTRGMFYYFDDDDDDNDDDDDRGCGAEEGDFHILSLIDMPEFYHVAYYRVHSHVIPLWACQQQC